MDKDQGVIPYHLVGQVPAWWLSITVEFSKADQMGHGRILMHHVQIERPTECVVCRMQEYISITRDIYQTGEHTRLFDITSFPAFTAITLVHLMRATCGQIGVPADKVSAHSLRYGWATTMSQAGFP